MFFHSCFPERFDHEFRYPDETGGLPTLRPDGGEAVAARCGWTHWLRYEQCPRSLCQITRSAGLSVGKRWRIDPHGTAILRRADPTCRDRRWDELFRQLCVGFIRDTGGAASARTGSFALRAIRWTAQSGNWFGRSPALQLAFSLPYSRGQMVGRHCFHLKQHAFLPVGRTGSRVVRFAWLSDAAARHDGSIMDTRNDLVFDAITRKCAASAARWDAFHFRRSRLGRRLLGSADG